MFQAPSPGEVRIASTGVFSLLAALALAIALQISHGFVDLTGLIWLALGAFFCAAALVSTPFELILPPSDRTVVRRSFVLAIALYFMLSLTVLRLHHDPIDVVSWQNDAARMLLHGADPYGQSVTHREIDAPNLHLYPGISVNGQVHVGFTYPPLTLLLAIPSYLLGDVRYSSLFAVALSAALMFYLAPNIRGLIAATVLMFLPETQFVLRFGFTDSLVVLALAATVFCAMRAPRWLPVALGLFFLSKQYTIVTLPVAALLLPKFSWKAYFSLLGRAAAVVLVFILPFLWWDPRGLWFSLVGFHVAVPLRTDALTLSALLVTHGFRPVPMWLAIIVIAFVIFVALKRAPRSPAGFSISVAVVSLIGFVLAKQAFCGYYFYCVGALCIGLASSGFGSTAPASYGLIKLSSSHASPLAVTRKEDSPTAASGRQ